ncbi:MAG: rhomboid family intramembrane serine protease [Bacteroidetes bacterium]|nr:MAG: rhomboid family intramembrane serine protease [Bacteroidota bacterium]
MSILLPIIVITAGISLYAMKRPEVINQLVLSPYKIIHNKEYYRLLTHGFIHGSGMHLAINLFVLWEFGEIVEYEFGSAFPLLYIGGLLIAAIPAIKKHKDDVTYNSLGASGAVSAILMAFIVAHPSHTLLLFFVIPIPAILAGILFFVFERIMLAKGKTGIAHDAHLYGAAYGLVFALILDPNGINRMITALLDIF